MTEREGAESCALMRVAEGQNCADFCQAFALRKLVPVRSINAALSNCHIRRSYRSANTAHSGEL